MGLFDFFKSSKNSESDHDKDFFEKYGIKAKTLYQSNPSEHMSTLKKLSEYSATDNEILEVQSAINKDGFWEESLEWKISTVMTSRIEPKIENNKKWFITIVKCEQEVMIPAATIERAIIFKKIYQDFQIELVYEQGWASWAKKNEP